MSYPSGCQGVTTWCTCSQSARRCWSAWDRRERKRAKYHNDTARKVPKQEFPNNDMSLLRQQTFSNMFFPFFVSKDIVLRRKKVFLRVLQDTDFALQLHFKTEARTAHLPFFEQTEVSLNNGNSRSWTIAWHLSSKIEHTQHVVVWPPKAMETFFWPLARFISDVAVTWFRPEFVVKLLRFDGFSISWCISEVTPT